jgi:hypothetical protein
VSLTTGSFLDDIARHLGLGSATVTLPDAGTATELLDRVGFVIPEEGVSTVAQRHVFDRARRRRDRSATLVSGQIWTDSKIGSRVRGCPGRPRSRTMR